MKLSFRKSYLRLLIIMIFVTLMTTGLCLEIIYNVVYNEKKGYLKELCLSQLNIIKSIYKLTNDENQILNILKESNNNHLVFGETGEYIIAVLRNDSINLLLDLRRSGYSNVKPIPWKSGVAEPIKYALSKKTGFLTGRDYSNIKVLSYCANIPGLDWGLVTKMDISEVNYPFYKAGFIAFFAALILVILGTLAFKRAFDPIIKQIIDDENRYRNLFDYSAIPIWEVDFSPVKKHFDKLRESGITNFKTYFESNKDEIRHLTSLVRITYVNQKSVTFLEANNKDEIINNLLSYFNEDSLEVFKNEIAGLAEGITHFETELPIRTLKGEIKTLLFHMSVMPGHEIDLSEVLISFVDITKRKVTEEALRKSEQKLKYHFENSPLAVVEWDTNYYIINWSKEAEHIFGWKFEEVAGKRIDTLNLIYEEDIPVVNSTMERLSGGKENTVVSTNRNYTKSGDIIQCIWYNSVLLDNDGQMTSTMSLVADITERKKAEEALKMREAQLKELNATKDKFFNIVAHDLKNPFTSLLGSTELLYESIHLMDSEKIRKLAQILNDSAKSGYAILLNLLDWSRSQTGLIKLNPEEINLKSLIDKNISELQLYSTNKKIKIYSEENEDFFVFADMNMINTVLRNLLSNGVKFTRKGGKVTVSVAITENEVTISVKDTGIGISEENIKKLFRIDTKFQLPGTDNEQGTGLGLKLCKEFVEKLGGKIWVESIENKGSNFKFSIPVKVITRS